jgi:hypothetical protein
VKVTDCPQTDGFCDEVSVIVVLDLVGVAVGPVGVFVGVLVGVAVGPVGVFVGVLVGVAVGPVGVLVGVLVGVAVGPTTPSPSNRATRLRACPPTEVNAPPISTFPSD